ncbi:MAG: hypothetical protein HY692_09135 [Cyanobacteria bacterium NC_groundwater_1444_Ag_S-0.65um_54_12]|nr:hypothetical protein [Cyanobacteria bacterium NC_groundwater_1444_Ag_S-0.65um_54_12]
MRNYRIFPITVILVALVLGCSPKESKQAASGITEHYSSAQVQGQKGKINLDAVHQAFFETAGKDFAEWMQNFEKRANEIYEGEEVLLIDADRKAGLVRVAGYLEKNNQPGLQPADDKLFQLQQTGASNGQQGFPYQLSGADGAPHYQGYPPPQYQHGLLDNPFVQLFVLSQLMRPGWQYSTPPGKVVVLRDGRTNYRATPRYQTQMSQNKGFFGRLFGKKQEPLKSQRTFGGNPGYNSNYRSSGSGQDYSTKRRSWFGGGSSNDGRWSGRRSSGSGSGWGNRRSGGFRSWGGGRRR